MKPWFQNYDIDMYTTHNQGKFDVPDRFIKALKNKIYKYMTSLSKHVYIDKLDNVVNKYNHTYHNTINMKPSGLKSSLYTDVDKKNNKKDPKFKFGDHVRISKYKNNFAKGYVPNWSE